jgi:DNA sulfur modification protein DndD
VDLNASTEARLKARKNDLNLGSLERLDAVAVTDLVDRIRACDLFRTEEIEWLRDMENSLLEARSRKVDLDGEEKRIRAEHSDRPRGDREQQMRRLTEINQKLGSARGNRAEAIKQLDELKARAISLQARANMIHTNPAVQRMARISRFAVQAFEKAIDGFREAARERVERGASDVFQQLLTEPGYAGIEIDRNYRLTTVDRDGAALPIPSAGGQQLVTLALIGGLNAAAVHEAPIVMDTPAGRIDRPNRERILRWVQGLDRQVVLMVHSGEFTAEHVREMNVPVGRVYKIEKVGPKSSRIYPASLDGSA